MTPQARRQPLAHVHAAMEPAEDRPDDAAAPGADLGWSHPPQWSRPRIGRMTTHPLARSFRRRGAAMEPAEDRPDDSPCPASAAMTAIAAMEPAEDRPDDAASVFRSTNRGQPQWSRPRIGRMTGKAPACALPKPSKPQWSRPRIGRMTGMRGRPPSCPPGAMEPAEDRPDDGLSPGGRSPFLPVQWSRPRIGRMTGNGSRNTMPPV